MRGWWRWETLAKSRKASKAGTLGAGSSKPGSNLSRWSDRACGTGKVGVLLLHPGARRARDGRRHAVMTDSEQSLPAASTLKRQFLVELPGWVWMAGIAYSPTQEGWLYLALVMSLYRWMIVLAPRPGLEPGTYGLTVREREAVVTTSGAV